MNLLLTPFLDKWGTLTRLSYVLRLICGNIDSIAKGRLKCRESLIQGLKISREKKAVLVGVSVPAGCPGSGVQGCVRVLWLRWQIATTFVASNSTYVLLQCGRPKVGTTLPELSSRRLTNPPPPTTAGRICFLALPGFQSLRKFLHSIPGSRGPLQTSLCLPFIRTVVIVVISSSLISPSQDL